MKNSMSSVVNDTDVTIMTTGKCPSPMCHEPSISHGACNGDFSASLSLLL